MFRKITLLTLWLALIVILLGAIVQLSNAQMACPDWPTCYGEVVISNDIAFKTQVFTEFAQNKFNAGKSWLKLIHRYSLAMLGFMLVILAITAYTQKQHRLITVIITFLLVSLGMTQITFDKWTTDFNGMPIIVTVQLLSGFITFWLLYWLYLRTQPQIQIKQQTAHLWQAILAKLAVIFIALQIALGLWVSSNNAALACSDFPRCNAMWIPAVDYLGALDLWSGLKNNYAGVLSFDGQVAVHWLHRAVAVISFIWLTLLILNATSEQYARPIRKAGLLLSILLMIQISLGIMSIKFGAPFGLSLGHYLFGALLMLPLLAINFYRKYTLIDTLVATEQPAQDTDNKPTPSSLYLRLVSQLQKTRSGLGGTLSHLTLTKKSIDDNLREQIETSLLMADVGVDTSTEIIATLTERLQKQPLNNSETPAVVLKQILLDILQPCCQPLIIPPQENPFVILVIGVNGAGKTTTIGKLAKRLQSQGHQVMLVAGDTFRAAAVEQLEAWGERNKIQVVAQHSGADVASVIYDGVQSAQAKNVDVLLVDTAGRLHTQSNLMAELKKAKRIMSRLDATAPHEVLLILDAGIGQNALSQSKIFNEQMGLTGLALTKLDGTAKGGIIFALARQLNLPIRFIGVGEGIDDLQDFDAKTFINALFVQDLENT